MLGKTYCFLHESENAIVALFTVSNDSLKLHKADGWTKRKVRELLPHAKTFSSYPAVLIGRLGVNSLYAGNDYGGAVLKFIKGWFIESENKTGCRFLMVDAYNENYVLSFYQKNNFKFLYKDETVELQATGRKENSLTTRFMYFDLKTQGD